MLYWSRLINLIDLKWFHLVLFDHLCQLHIKQKWILHKLFWEFVLSFLSQYCWSTNKRVRRKWNIWVILSGGRPQWWCKKTSTHMFGVNPDDAMPLPAGHMTFWVRIFVWCFGGIWFMYDRGGGFQSTGLNSCSVLCISKPALHNNQSLICLINSEAMGIKFKNLIR